MSIKTPRLLLRPYILVDFDTGLIQEKMPAPKPATSTLTVEETRLFKIINKGFSDDFWVKLTNLNKKRQTFTLSESDRKELIEMTEALDAINLERMKALIELATIRHIDLDILINQLGLNKDKHSLN
jgi:hypothetical protein